jgi:hypothetical protein
MSAQIDALQAGKQVRLLPTESQSAWVSQVFEQIFLEPSQGKLKS